MKQIPGNTLRIKLRLMGDDDRRVDVRHDGRFHFVDRDGEAASIRA